MLVVRIRQISQTELGIKDKNSWTGHEHITKDIRKTTEKYEYAKTK